MSPLPNIESKPLEVLVDYEHLLPNSDEFKNGAEAVKFLRIVEHTFGIPQYELISSTENCAAKKTQEFDQIQKESRKN